MSFYPLPFRKTNVLLSAISITVILAILGFSYLSFGMNTRIVVRSTYVDQIASYLSEANAPITFKNLPLPVLKNLYLSSRLEMAGGGLFGVEARVSLEGQVGNLPDCAGFEDEKTSPSMTVDFPTFFMTLPWRARPVLIKNSLP